MPRKKNVESDADGLPEDKAPRVEPAPGKIRAAGTRGRKSNATVEKELREQFTVFMGVIAMMWAARGDDVCSGSLADNAEPLAGGFAHMFAKMKFGRKLATAMTDTGVLLPFGFAVVNFGQTVYAHHSPKGFPEAPPMGGFGDAAAPVDLTGRSV